VTRAYYFGDLSKQALEQLTASRWRSARVKNANDWTICHADSALAGVCGLCASTKP
jgi:hypothetical protein